MDTLANKDPWQNARLNWWPSLESHTQSAIDHYIICEKFHKYLEMWRAMFLQGFGISVRRLLSEIRIAPPHHHKRKKSVTTCSTFLISGDEYKCFMDLVLLPHWKRRRARFRSPECTAHPGESVGLVTIRMCWVHSGHDQWPTLILELGVKGIIMFVPVICIQGKNWIAKQARVFSVKIGLQRKPICFSENGIFRF